MTLSRAPALVLVGGKHCLAGQQYLRGCPLQSTAAGRDWVGENLVESSDDDHCCEYHEYVAGSGILVPMRIPGNVQIQVNICGIQQEMRRSRLSSYLEN